MTSRMLNRKRSQTHEATEHNRPPKRGAIPPWLRHGPLFLLLIFLSGYSSPAASAAFDVESCMPVVDELKMQLNRKFKRTDKTGLADRRKKMNDLAQSVSSSCAWMLLYKVGRSTKHRDPELRELIERKLAEPTVRQFIDILAGQACCAEDDLDDWGRKFESEAEREVYIVNYFDDFFDDIELDRSRGQKAVPDAECVLVQNELAAQLHRKFTSADKKGLADRRNKMNTLFENTSRECAYVLLYRLGNEKHGDAALQELFYGKLASPTRKQLRGILIRKIRAPFPEEISDGTSKTISSITIERTEKNI